MLSCRNKFLFFGLVVIHPYAFKFSPLHYRRIQLRYIDNLKQGNDYIDLFSFDGGSMDDLSWWFSLPDSLTSLSFISFCLELAIYTELYRKT